MNSVVKRQVQHLPHDATAMRPNIPLAVSIPEPAASLAFGGTDCIGCRGFVKTRLGIIIFLFLFDFES
jgi:hypothetical protein